MFVSAVSQSIQAINEAVDVGDPAQTLAALRNPGAGLYGVTSECAQTYQDDLVKIKDEKKAEGEDKSIHHNGAVTVSAIRKVTVAVLVVNVQLMKLGGMMRLFCVFKVKLFNEEIIIYYPNFIFAARLTNGCFFMSFKKT